MGPADGSRQNVQVESGVGYGVIGADLHVFGDGVPLYLLLNWRSVAAPDAEWLREMPSRMLNPRFAVAEFTGRGAELDALRQWRDGDAPLAVRWLRGPGGQGKSRLASLLAEESREAGWKVVTAVQGPGTVLPPNSQEDLRLGDACGLLLIVDYADRWPLAHLAWLFSNALLHQSAVPVRVLLLARTTDTWPTVRALLADHQAATSGQLLAPLPPEARPAMFEAAVDGYGSVLGVADAEPPARLDHDDYGLTLALHMAALVAVDARSERIRPPTDLVGLTCYLLDREHLHWGRRFGDDRHRLGPAASGFSTPPAAMNRTVFAAALTGAVPHSAGAAVLERIELSTPVDAVLRDHAVCYPPELGTVLEPLAPDRLAEDFLALTTPGHTADYPAQDWASGVATVALLDTTDSARAVSFLAAATARWPHVGPAYFYPLLCRRPELAAAAGAGALSAIAAIPSIELAVLDAIDDALRLSTEVGLRSGVADVAVRRTALRLPSATDPTERALLLMQLSRRLDDAGRHQEALDTAEQAVAAMGDRSGRLLATALSLQVRPLRRLDRPAEALAVSRSVVEMWSELATVDEDAVPALAEALVNLRIGLADHGLTAEALSTAEAAVARSAGLGSAYVASAEANLSSRLADLGHLDAALHHAQQAAQLTETLGDDLPDLARRLGDLHLRYVDAGRWEEAAVIAERVVTLWRRLADLNQLAFEPELAKSLNHHGVCLRQLGRPQDAVLATREAIGILRRRAPGPDLAAALGHLSDQLAILHRYDESVAASRESVALFRRVAVVYPRYQVELAKELDNLGIRLNTIGQPQSALAASQEGVALLIPLAHENPALVTDLARTYFNLAFRHAAVGAVDEAFRAIGESVRLRRTLPHPEDLARSLYGFAVLCVRFQATHRRREALHAINEAITIYQSRPARFRPDLLAATDIRDHLRTLRR